MMKQVQRVLATVAVTAVLGLGGGALATPAAAADVDVNALGGAATAVVDSFLGAGLLGIEIVHLPISLDNI
ncbi:hypothetical protein ACWD4B_18190 [Streptomyces sp. NPDC002536]